MQQDGLEQVMDIWMKDTSFRADMRQDPEAALQSRGIQLSEDDQEALNGIDWNASDEQLQQRVSKWVRRM